MAKDNNHIYNRELFDKLRKNVSLRKEEECFGVCLKPSFWWMIEKQNPTINDISKVIRACPHIKRSSRKKDTRCIEGFLNSLNLAQKSRILTKFDCAHGLHGFIYPIGHGDKVYGFLGACHAKKDVSPEMLEIFAAFTDTIVKEAQKELELSKLYETIRPRAIALSTVHTVYRLISSTLDLNELLPRIARLSLQILRANRCSIKLVDSTKKLLLPKATVDLRQKKTRLKKVRVGRFAPGKAVKYGKSIRSDNFLAIPLIDEDVIGVITLYDKLDNKPFSQFDQEIMTTLAEQAVIAIKNAQLYKEQERLTTGVIKSLSAIANAQQPGSYVARPSFVRIAIAMGNELKLNPTDLKNLEYAVLLHDAGQIVVPKNLLTKPNKLTSREYALVKEHPEKGVQIIKHIDALRSILPYILYHHENFDGTGYPKGLKKGQIPLGARIMAVVGAFEAMIMKRPYRIVKTIDQATAEIIKNSGTQFDPKVAEVFLNIIARKDMRAMLEREIYESKRRS